MVSRIPWFFIAVKVESGFEGTPVTGEGNAWLGCFPSPRVFMSFGFDSPYRFSIPIAQDSVEVTLPERGGGGVVRLGGSPDPPEGEQASHRHVVVRAGDVARFEVGATEKEVRDVRFVIINDLRFRGPSTACADTPRSLASDATDLPAANRSSTLRRNSGGYGFDVSDPPSKVATHQIQTSQLRKTRGTSRSPTNQGDSVSRADFDRRGAF